MLLVAIMKERGYVDICWRSRSPLFPPRYMTHWCQQHPKYVPPRISCVTRGQKRAENKGNTARITAMIDSHSTWSCASVNVRFLINRDVEMTRRLIYTHTISFTHYFISTSLVFRKKKPESLISLFFAFNQFLPVKGENKSGNKINWKVKKLLGKLLVLKHKV